MVQPDRTAVTHRPGSAPAGPRWRPSWPSSRPAATFPSSEIYRGQGAGVCPTSSEILAACWTLASPTCPTTGRCGPSAMRTASLPDWSQPCRRQGSSMTSGPGSPHPGRRSWAVATTSIEAATSRAWWPAAAARRSQAAAGRARRAARGNHEVMPPTARDGALEWLDTGLEYGRREMVRRLRCGEPDPERGDRAAGGDGWPARPVSSRGWARCAQAARWRDVLFVHGGRARAQPR